MQKQLINKIYMNTKLTILVNTTDSFSDVWPAFFKLFAENWPDCPHQIVLNTESAEYSYPNLNIVCSKVGLGQKSINLTWSTCLMRCLESIQTDTLLYLQEDYFLNRPVRFDLIDHYVNLLVQKDLHNIRLMECSGAGPWIPTENEYLWEVDLKSNYRISLQAGIWNTKILKSLLLKHETPWQFEIWGTKRIQNQKYRIYCINRDKFSGPETQIVPYQPTGIIRGKWNRDAVYDLFKEHGIAIDYSQRGFYDPNNRGVKSRPLWKKIYDRVRSL